MSQELVTSGRKATLADHVAANLRAELAARRLNANDLAKVLNVGVRAASRRMSGDIELSLNELDIVSRWLGVTRSQMMTERSQEHSMAVAS